MKTHKFTAAALLAAAALGTAAFAQSPAVSAAPAAPAAPPVSAAPAVNETVYVPQLPSAEELTKAATAQGVTVTRISQSASQVTITYQYPNGQINTVAYQPLSNADASLTTAPAGVPMPSSPASGRRSADHGGLHERAGLLL